MSVSSQQHPSKYGTVGLDVGVVGRWSRLLWGLLILAPIVIPGVTPDCEIGASSGPQGPVCSTMHFFSSPQAASTWLVAHPGVEILPVDQAWHLAQQEVWVKPYQDYRG